MLLAIIYVPFVNSQKSGPNTITFLSYPKYYTTAEGELTPVVTNLSESKRPDWDFEVTTGIWTLRVRTDGTFQAEHQGNVFTYRLAQIGVGRGEGFRAFEWGEPNWKNYQVVGDSIRWYGIFRDVDLRVRYIHDILKVDVIVKAALMNDIRADVRSGKLNADEEFIVQDRHLVSRYFGSMAFTWKTLRIDRLCTPGVKK